MGKELDFEGGSPVHKKTCPVCGGGYRLAMMWNAFDPSYVDEGETTHRHEDKIYIHAGGE